MTLDWLGIIYSRPILVAKLKQNLQYKNMFFKSRFFIKRYMYVICKSGQVLQWFQSSSCGLQTLSKENSFPFCSNKRIDYQECLLLINSVQTKCQNQETVVFYEVEKPKVQHYIFFLRKNSKSSNFLIPGKVEQQRELSLNILSIVLVPLLAIFIFTRPDFRDFFRSIRSHQISSELQ